MSQAASTEPESLATSVRRCVEIVRKRLWVVVAVIAVGVTAAVLYTMRLPRIYQAVSTVVVNPQAPRVFGNQVDEVFELGTGSYWSNQEYYNTQLAVITGFATIETAVETMQFGAVDYVQKPFTEDELVAFANRLLIKRQARLDAQRRPTVRIVTPELAETVGAREYCVPGGAFVAPGHTWAQLEPDGPVSVGIDDFGRKALRKVERIEASAAGTRVQRGDVLLVMRRGEETVRFPRGV